MNWKHFILFPIVAIAHAHVALAAAFLSFVLILGVGVPESIAATPVEILLWFPRMLFDRFGLNLGPFDGGLSIVLNSLCWTAVVYPIWYLTWPIQKRAFARFKKFVARTGISLICVRFAPLILAIVFGLFGVVGGYLFAMSTTSASAGGNLEDKGETETVTIRLLDVAVHTEFGPRGMHRSVMHDWYARIRKYCAWAGLWLGLLSGIGVGLLIRREYQRKRTTLMSPAPHE